MESKVKSLYQIKVTLNDIQPPIWRRFLVPDTLTLYQLHAVLQVVMGWTSSHLHQFTINGEDYGDPANDEFGIRKTKDENRFKLNRVIQGEGFKFQYAYDFGDSWEHTLLVEKIQSPDVVDFAPVCLKGKRACPPEDVGGVLGYYQFLEAVNDPKHPEHDNLIEWYGGEFDSENFETEVTNRELELLAAMRYDLEAFFDAVMDLYDLDAIEGIEAEFDQAEQKMVALKEILEGFFQNLDPVDAKTAEDLPLRRDMVALLTYLQTHTVKSTGTGMLPLKAVREICAQFVKPPVLDHQLGDKLYKLRSERDVFPLEFLHALAHVNHFFESLPNRKYELTETALAYLTLPPIMQVIQLFMSWVASVNWQMSFGYGGLGDTLTGDSQMAAFRELAKLPANTTFPFEPFAGRLISVTGWKWSVPDNDSTLHAAVEHMVIDRLIDFGVATAEYVPHPLLGGDYKKITSFQITPFGHKLMRMISQFTSLPPSSQDR